MKSENWKVIFDLNLKNTKNWTFLSISSIQQGAEKFAFIDLTVNKKSHV